MDGTAMARLLDELRGGTWGLEAERAKCRRVLAVWPKAPAMIRWLDQFRSAVAESAVRQRGVTALVFGAEGFPVAGDPPHAAAARAGTGARYFYPQHNSAIRGQRARSVAGDPAASVIAASFRDAEAVAKAVRAAVGDGPWQVQRGLGAMRLDYREAESLAAAYAGLMPPGSELVMAVPDGGGGAALAAIAGARAHSAGDLAAWCDAAGLALDAAPGFSAGGGGIAVAIGRVP